jgi:6-pyruvoyltetrahydropterin/6-carboxytetrahydropterin synthase
VWTLEKEFRFEASHRLPHHGGKCARLHGHSWRVRVVCSSQDLHQSGPRAGMVLDYGDISEIMKPILQNFLDHYHLNESLALENPTSEEVARWIFKKIKPLLPTLNTIILEETCTSRCSYSE